jgi:hypothetical protein
MPDLGGVHWLDIPTTRRLNVGWALVSVVVPSACAEGAVPTRLLTSVVDVKAGERHTCVFTAASGVKCWGFNHDGIVGGGTDAANGVAANGVGSLLLRAPGRARPPGIRC